VVTRRKFPVPFGHWGLGITKLLQSNQITYRYKCWKVPWKQTSARKSKIEVLSLSCHIYTRSSTRHSVRYPDNCQTNYVRRTTKVLYFSNFQLLRCEGSSQGLSEFPQIRSKPCSFDICWFPLIPATVS
jgi:hypothetical protein